MYTCIQRTQIIFYWTSVVIIFCMDFKSIGFELTINLATWCSYWSVFGHLKSLLEFWLNYKKQCLVFYMYVHICTYHKYSISFFFSIHLVLLPFSSFGLFCILPFSPRLEEEPKFHTIVDYNKLAFQQEAVYLPTTTTNLTFQWRRSTCNRKFTATTFSKDFHKKLFLINAMSFLACVALSLCVQCVIS